MEDCATHMTFLVAQTVWSRQDSNVLTYNTYFTSFSSTERSYQRLTGIYMDDSQKMKESSELLNHTRCAGHRIPRANTEWLQHLP